MLAQATDVVSLADAASTLSPPAVAFLVLFLVIRGILVTRGQYEALQEDRNEWRTIAKSALSVGEAVARTNDG